MKEGESYRPSNGTEGMIFDDNFCSHCIHEKYCHTYKDGDKQCDILSRAFLFDQRDKEYPTEWQYDANGKPTCIAYVNWDWGSDDDEGGLNEPPPPEPYDPMQLVFPFFIDEYINQPQTA